MKVVVSVLGRFHAFDLARELASQDALARLFTSYPAGAARRFEVPAERVIGLPWHEAFNRGVQRVYRWSEGRIDGRHRPSEVFDRAVAKRLADYPSEVFVGWSGSALASLKRARELGMLAVLERGSTHIVHQSRILEAEYESLGVRGRLPHPRIVERELEEYRLADRIMVPSSFVRRTFLEQGIPEHKVLQVPYGVSLESFRPPEAPAEGMEIMHCGAVSLRKGCHHLLQAFRELDHPQARLRFVGPVLPEMSPYIQRYGGERIEFVGQVPQSELPKLYRQAAVFALASLEEGMAMVVPQAMACGLPVVATPQSGAGDLVRDGREGFLVPVGNATALAHRLKILLEDRSMRHAMGERAVQRVRSAFTWQDYGRGVFQAYLRACGNGKSFRSAA